MRRIRFDFDGKYRTGGQHSFTVANNIRSIREFTASLCIIRCPAVKCSYPMNENYNVEMQRCYEWGRQKDASHCEPTNSLLFRWLRPETLGQILAGSMAATKRMANRERLKWKRAINLQGWNDDKHTATATQSASIESTQNARSELWNASTHSWRSTQTQYIRTLPYAAYAI